MLEKPTLGNLLVALPVVHLIVAALSTWAWLSGFGANVVVLTDPRDLFSTSISQIILIYFVGLSVPVISAIHHSKTLGKTRTGIDIRGLPKGSKIRSLFRMLNAIFFSAIAVSFLFVLDSKLTYNSLGFGVVLGIFLLQMPILLWLLVNIEVSFSSFQAIYLVTGLLFASVAMGLASGNNARHVSLESSVGGMLMCGEYSILRRFGDSYIVIGKDNQRRVTDLECKVIMTVPDTPPVAKRTFTSSFPFIRYVPIPEKPQAAPSPETAPPPPEGRGGA